MRTMDEINAEYSQYCAQLGALAIKANQFNQQTAQEADKLKKQIALLLQEAELVNKQPASGLATPVETEVKGS